MEETFAYDNLDRLTEVWTGSVRTGLMVYDGYDAWGSLRDPDTYNSLQLEQGKGFSIKEGFQNAMNIWGENIKSTFGNMQFNEYSVNVQFEYNDLTPETSRTILINKNNREAK